MKTLAFLLFISFSFFASAQKTVMYSTSKAVVYKYSTTVENDIRTIKFNECIHEIDSFILKNKLKVNRRKKLKKRFFITFIIESEKQFTEYKSMAENFGYFTLNTIKNENYSDNLAILNSELAYWNEKSNAYNKQMELLDKKSDVYLNLWTKNEDIKDKIFEKQQQISNITKAANFYKIELELKDEINIPENSDVSWVNMPGFEYSILNIETPRAGITSSQYQGYSLKYLFTRGKSYFTAGAYKSTDKEKIDSIQFPELFTLGFGQDFYSRHLGRGSRKFLNLYSGYSLGVLLTNKDSETKFDMYLAPSIGLEIYKNKYILIDTKASYFIPISNNSSLRGWTISGSFNFMF